MRAGSKTIEVVRVKITDAGAGRVEGTAAGSLPA
jgi:hypothetical protein